ncbi:MAG TPA: rhomboid family intramembrane serine protease [Candidatus Dietzia intestinipullorum]|nr:rhomboid family intramembrane serine protease [Candidatus Dietzia intestinipullorum]
MWVVEAGDQVLQSMVGPPGLDDRGVDPLKTDGLTGIVFQPFLHADWAHLISNSIGLLVLGTIIALSGMKPLLKVTLVSWVLSGAVSWLIGGVGTMHIGASGIVFGYIFYVIVRGLFTRRFLHLIVGLVIGFYYGLGALAGLSPLQDGISWQGHLGGTIGGVLSAAGLRKERGKQTAVNAGQVRWSAGPPR